MPYIALNPGAATAIPAPTIASGPMSDKTFVEFQNALIPLLGNRADVGLAQIKSWLNSAYRYISSVLTLDSLKSQLSFATVAAQPLYSLPNVVGRIIDAAVVDTSHTNGGWGLVPIDADMYRNLPNQSVDSSYKLGNFMRQGNLLVLYPTPSAVQTVLVDFRIRVNTLVADADRILLPAEFDDVILQRAKHEALRDLRDYAGAAIARNDTASDIAALEDSEGIEKAAVPHGLRPISSFKDFRRPGR